MAISRMDAFPSDHVECMWRSTKVAGVAELVAYCSRFMTLYPGDPLTPGVVATPWYDQSLVGSQAPLLAIRNWISLR